MFKKYKFEKRNNYTVVLIKRRRKSYQYDSSETDHNAFLESAAMGGNRLIHPNGTFNIEKRGNMVSNLYEKLLSLSWSRTLLLFLTFYFIINGIFAFIFLAIGPENILGATEGSPWHNYTQMLYFSIQTFTTVGYGQMSPSGSAANLLSSFIAFLGLLSFALVAGLSFAKFSKPQAHIILVRTC